MSLRSPEINLLADTPCGHTWLEAVLDVEPEEFCLEHVRGAKAALQQLADGEVGVVSIARWRPIVVFVLPERGAAEIVRAFEAAEGFGPVPVLSMRVDGESARMFSRTRDEQAGPGEPAEKRPVVAGGDALVDEGARHLAGKSVAGKSARHPSRGDPRRGVRYLARLGYRAGRAVFLAVLAAVAVLVGGGLAVLGRGAWAVRQLWARAGRASSSASLPAEPARDAEARVQEHLERWAVDVRSLVALGWGIPSQGLGPAREALVTEELRQVLEMRRPAAWTWSDWRIAGSVAVRTVVVGVALSARVVYRVARGPVIAVRNIWRELRPAITSAFDDLCEDLSKLFGHLAEQSELRARRRAILRRQRLAASPAWEGLFEDPNDYLFAVVLVGILLITAGALIFI